LVDLGIIAAAPTRFLAAGMGDALATWFEARSCDRTLSPNECGGYGTLVGLHIARVCYETVMKYGAAAKVASERHIATPALDHFVEANILLSGIGYESAGLAAAHAIHDGLTALGEAYAFYHGEKVAFGFWPDSSPQTHPGRNLQPFSPFVRKSAADHACRYRFGKR
jgi:glycerol dehydrogenase